MEYLNTGRFILRLVGILPKQGTEGQTLNTVNLGNDTNLVAEPETESVSEDIVPTESDTDSDKEDKESNDEVDDNEYLDLETTEGSTEGSQQVAEHSTEIVDKIEVKCKKHVKYNITHVCKDCRVTVCAYCIKRKHATHYCTVINESEAILQKMLRAGLCTMECALENIEDTVGMLAKSKDTVISVHNDNIANLEKRRDTLISGIYNEYEDINETVLTYKERDSQSFDSSIEDMEEFANEIKYSFFSDVDNDKKDPIKCVKCLVDIELYANKCRDLISKLKSEGQPKVAYSLNADVAGDVGEYLRKYFAIRTTLDPDNTDLESSSEETDSNNTKCILTNDLRVEQTPLPLLEVFESNNKQIGSHIENNYVCAILNLRTFEIYKLQEDTCIAIGPETCTSLRWSSLGPTIIGDTLVCYAQIAIGERNTYHYQAEINFYSSDLQFLKTITFCNLSIIGITQFDKSKGLVLGKESDMYYLQFICAKDYKFLDKYQLQVSQPKTWKFLGNPLVTSNKSLVLFSMESTTKTKRVQIYQNSGASGRTIFMLENVLQNYQTAVLDSDDQIWISDKGQLKRFSLGGSETFCLNLGKQIIHLMTDGVAMYVHYIDNDKKKKFEKIELKGQIAKTSEK